MALNLPAGTKLYLSTTFGSPKTVSAVSNADPGVCSSTAHGFSAADILLMTSGWGELNGRAIRVATSPTTDAFSMEGFDTSNTSRFPAGTGAGTATEVTAFTQIAEVLEFTGSGGEPKDSTFQLLENTYESSLPDGFSASKLNIAISDDASLAGYQALKDASDNSTTVVLKTVAKNGKTSYYVGRVGFNETPVIQQGAPNRCKAVFNLTNPPVVYTA